VGIDNVLVILLYATTNYFQFRLYITLVIDKHLYTGNNIIIIERCRTSNIIIYDDYSFVKCFKLTFVLKTI